LFIAALAGSSCGPVRLTLPSWAWPTHFLDTLLGQTPRNCCSFSHPPCPAAGDSAQLGTTVTGLSSIHCVVALKESLPLRVLPNLHVEDAIPHFVCECSLCTAIHCCLHAGHQLCQFTPREALSLLCCFLQHPWSESLYLDLIWA